MTDESVVETEVEAPPPEPTPGLAWLDEDRHPTLARMAGTLLVVALFVLLRWVDDVAFTLDEEGYAASVLLTGMLRRPAALAALLVPVIAVLACWRRLSWRRLESRPLVRVLATAMAFVLVWAYACLHHNDFFDQSHSLDRWCLLLLAALVPVHPVFVIGALAQAALISHQLDFPLHLTSNTDKRPIFDVLVVVEAALLVRLIAPRLRFTRTVLFIVLVLTAANYFRPGYAKVKIGWLAHEDLSLLFLAARDNGWLSGLSDDRVQSLVALLRALWWPLGITTLILELGAFFMLGRRWLAIGLLAGCSLLHVGIFAASGICFWKWVLLNSTLMACLIAMPAAARRDLFERRLFILSLVLIAFSHTLFRPKALGWYDTPLSTVYRFEAVGESDQLYEVAPIDMAPYEFSFAQGRFHFLSEGRSLMETYGSTHDLPVLEALLAANSREDIMAVVEQHGEKYSDPSQRAAMIRYLERTFAARNRAAGRESFLARLAPPPHKFTSGVTSLPRYDRRERVRRIVVLCTRTWLAPWPPQVVSSQVVLEVEIPWER